MNLITSKKIKEENVEEGKEFERILFWAKQNSWVYITHELEERLKKTYDNHPYVCSFPGGTIFKIEDGQKNWKIFVDKGSKWNIVTQIEIDQVPFHAQPVTISDDPQNVVFLF